MQQQSSSGQSLYIPHHARPAAPPLDGHARLALERACHAAARAAEAMAHGAAAQRAGLLDSIALRLEEERGAIRRLAMADTGCSAAAAEAEHAEALAELAAFAAVLRTPETAAGAVGRAALGAVAALGNGCLTPLYAAAGSQAMAALAAGCAVVTLRHHQHPRCSALIGALVQQALAGCGLPAGLYQALDEHPGSAEALLAHPAIRGVLYDGSRFDGLRYQHAALERADPIPVLGQLPGSNPVFILPAALNARAEYLGQQLLRQFMPPGLHQAHRTGLVVAVEGPGFIDLREAIMDTVSAMPPVPMANHSISCYHRGSVDRLLNAAGVDLLAQGAEPAGAPSGARAMFAEADAGALPGAPHLAEERPGPAALLLRCADAGQMLAVARTLRRQPMATLHLREADAADLALAGRLLPLLERMAAHVGINSFGAACQTPAAAADAIARLQRPVFIRNLPQQLTRLYKD